MTAVIVAAGQFPRKEYPLWLLGSADIVVCCDSALSALEKRGIVPAAVVGDLDSVCGRALKRFPGTVVRIEEQDTNDLTKAFRYLMQNFPDVTAVHILGATGYSEAHTIGNISLLMEYEKEFGLTGRGVTCDMVSDYSTIFAVSDSGEFHIGKGRRISLFSPDATLRIKSEGLQWPLDEVVFDNWWKASLNVASDDVVSLHFNHPSQALVILD